MKIAEIILALVLAIYASVEGVKWKKINWLKRSFVILAIIGDGIIAYNAIAETNKQKVLEKINASFGDISDLSDATIHLYHLE